MSKEKNQSKDQSWETCGFAISEGIDEIPLGYYGCKHESIVRLANHEELHMPSRIAVKSYRVLKTKDDEIVLFYPDYRFHEDQTALRGLARTFFMELKLYELVEKLERGELISEIPEEKVIERALAGCRHCKFHGEE